ncbi:MULTISPECIES: hypothetical protein [unclassified Streptomyces]|uniref:hypothetical protein n=1 Tax=unclassified Streptomyces TaxID=2593676 RepID=UPI002E0D4C5C|nr:MULTISPECIES: hypothetical protein [unclassified Streptomyces]WSR23044.1 hypothetical protein OG573_30550 [Streptomyces sp. NBC_01205]
MNRQTNRHRGLVLLAAPLLASSVVLSPAFAAQGGAVAAGAARVPSAPSCELVPGDTGKPGGNVRYDLHLSGFPANQSVRVQGKSSFRAMVDGQGALTRQGLRYGTYGVGYRESGSQQGKHVDCVTPPREKPGGGKGNVKVTKVEVLALTKNGSVVDCTTPPKIEFDGKITGTGTGKVNYYWTYNSSADPIASGTVEFTPGTTSHSLFKVVDGQVMANTSSTVGTFLTLHVPDQNMTGRSDTIVVNCAKQP